MTQLFISDLHLDPARPEAIEAFKELLATEAREAERLYILGDLFEAWIGDDDDTPLADEVAAALQDLHQHGTSCYFINGNRDFLLNRPFATRAGMHLLPEIALVDLGGKRTALMHGDLLCTDDTDYMRLRKIVNNKLFQSLFQALPLGTRRKIAEAARARSMASHGDKPEYIMDVAAATVERVFRTYEITQMIHGHTHRPDVHEFTIDDQPMRRIVLGDWYEQASVLRWNEDDFSLDAITL